MTNTESVLPYIFTHNQAAQAAKCHHQLLNKPRFQKTTWTSLGGDQCARKTSHNVQTFQLKLAENKFQVVTILWHAVLKRSNDQGFLIGNMSYTSWNGEMRVCPQPKFEYSQEVPTRHWICVDIANLASYKETLCNQCNHSIYDTMKWIKFTQM